MVKVVIPVLFVTGNNFSFSSLSIMLPIVLSYMAFIMLSYMPSVSTLLRVFVINRCWILSDISYIFKQLNIFLVVLLRIN